VLPAHALGVVRDCLLHAQGRVAGAHGVVLMGQRRAEERHDAVAHHLVHGALVAVHGLHRPFEHGVEELPRLLGIAVGEQLHGALEVGEQDGDLLALARKGGLRREDPLGQVLGRVGLGGGEARCRARAGDWLRTLEAELRARGKLCPAARASKDERRRALQAELRLRRVLLLAPGAFHEHSTTRRARLRSADDSVGAGGGSITGLTHDLSGRPYAGGAIARGRWITRTIRLRLPVAASVPQAHAGADRPRVARFFSRARACRRASSLNRRRQRAAQNSWGLPPDRRGSKAREHTSRVNPQAQRGTLLNGATEARWHRNRSPPAAGFDGAHRLRGASGGI